MVSLPVVMTKIDLRVDQALTLTLCRTTAVSLEAGGVRHSIFKGFVERRTQNNSDSSLLIRVNYERKIMIFHIRILVNLTHFNFFLYFL